MGLFQPKEPLPVLEEEVITESVEAIINSDNDNVFNTIHENVPTLVPGPYGEWVALGMGAYLMYKKKKKNASS